MEKLLHLLYLITARADNEWALSEIDPMHPDLPRRLLRQRELNERTGRLLTARTIRGSRRFERVLPVACMHSPALLPPQQGLLTRSTF